jgi:hypothetical protein
MAAAGTAITADVATCGVKEATSTDATGTLMVVAVVIVGTALATLMDAVGTLSDAPT